MPRKWLYCKVSSICDLLIIIRNLKINMSQTHRENSDGVDWCLLHFYFRLHTSPSFTPSQSCSCQALPEYWIAANTSMKLSTRDSKIWKSQTFAFSSLVYPLAALGNVIRGNGWSFTCLLPYASPKIPRPVSWANIVPSTDTLLVPMRETIPLRKGNPAWITTRRAGLVTWCACGGSRYSCRHDKHVTPSPWRPGSVAVHADAFMQSHRSHAWVVETWKARTRQNGRELLTRDVTPWKIQIVTVI